MLVRFKRYWHHALQLLEIKLHEKSYEHGLRYLFYNNHSDELIIVFSAFGSSNRRTYNYVRTLSGCKSDRLYILDPWGYKGSYNLYENGLDYPWHVTNKLIDKIAAGRGYKRIVTVGSSKGGSSALLFGLHHKVDKIIVGACQYNIGTYVARFPEVFHGMMGANAGDKEIDILDSLVGLALDDSHKCNHIPEIHVLYSKRELTYERQIKDFIRKLQDLNWPSVLLEEEFEDHGDVGKYFGPYLRSLFVNV